MCHSLKAKLLAMLRTIISRRYLKTTSWFKATSLGKQWVDETHAMTYSIWLRNTVQHALFLVPYDIVMIIAEPFQCWFGVSEFTKQRRFSLARHNIHCLYISANHATPYDRLSQINCPHNNTGYFLQDPSRIQLHDILHMDANKSKVLNHGWWKICSVILYALSFLSLR